MWSPSCRTEVQRLYVSSEIYDERKGRRGGGGGGTNLDGEIQTTDQLLPTSSSTRTPPSRRNDRHPFKLDLAHALKHAAVDARHVVERLVQPQLRRAFVDRVGRGVE